MIELRNKKKNEDGEKFPSFNFTFSVILFNLGKQNGFFFF